MIEQRCTRLVIGTLLLSLATIVLMAGSGISATFGDVEGRVVDGSTGKPLDGATISLETRGLRRETVTDSLGRYQFDNVVTGQYRLAVTAVGFNSLVVEHLPIVAGFTTYRFHLMTRSGGDGFQQGQPIGSVDGATVYSTDDIVRLPVRSFTDVLLLQPTVTESRSNAIQLREIQAASEPQNAPQLHVLGGRLWDHGYSINGVNFTEPISRSYTASVSPHAIDQLAFSAGTHSVTSYNGNAGAIEVLTRPGGEQYSGMVEVVTDNTVGSGYDQNYYTVRLSGPIPLLDKGLFMGTVERRWMRDRNPSPKSQEVLPGSPDKLPNNWQSGWSYHGRADYDFTDDLSVTLTGDKSTDEWSEYRHAYLFNIDHTPRYKDDNLGLSARLAYRANDNVSFSISSTYRETERIQGDGVVFDDYEAYERKFVWPDGEVDDIVNPGYDSYDLFWTDSEDFTVVANPDTTGWDYSYWLDTVIVDDDTTFSNPLDSAAVIFVDSVTTALSPYWGGYLHRKSSTVGVSGEIGARIGQYMIARAGFEYSRHTLRYFENLDATKGYSELRVIHYGYDSLGRESEDEGWQHETKHPTCLALYFQDRMSYRGFALTAGLRWERFDYKGQLVRDYLNPYGFGEPGVMDQADLIETSSFSKFSPSVRASYRFFDRLRVHAGFGIYHQLPPFRQVYNDWSFFEARVTSGAYFAFPFAGLTTSKSMQVDAGISVRICDRASVDLSAFWRKLTDENGIATFDSVDNSIRSYSIYLSGLESRSKGLTARIESRITAELRASFAYSLSRVDGDYNVAASSYVINWSNPTGTPWYSSVPRNYDRRHNFVGNLAWKLGKQQGPQVGGIHPLERFRLNLVARLSSGQPYTPSALYDPATEGAVRPGPAGPINSERMDWISTVDLKVEKRLTISGLQVVPFLWIKNLLNTENIADVWRVTGEPDSTGYLESEYGQIIIENHPDPDETGLNYEQKYRLKQANPQNYGPPRQIYFGLRAEF